MKELLVLFSDVKGYKKLLEDAAASGVALTEKVTN